MSAPDRAHSPLPWTLGDDGLVRDVEGRAIGDPVDSAFAVLAVNFHDQLVAALDELVEALRKIADGMGMVGRDSWYDAYELQRETARALLAEIESAER